MCKKDGKNRAFVRNGEGSCLVLMSVVVFMIAGLVVEGWDICLKGCKRTERILRSREGGRDGAVVAGGTKKHSKKE